MVYETPYFICDYCKCWKNSFPWFSLVNLYVSYLTTCKMGPFGLIYQYLVTMTTSTMVLSNTMVYCWSLGTTTLC